jgi:hypothetical protein
LALCPDVERAARHAGLVADVATAEGAHQTALAILEAQGLAARSAQMGLGKYAWNKR